MKSHYQIQKFGTTIRKICSRPGNIDSNNRRILGFVVFTGQSLPKGFEGNLLLDFRKSLGGDSSSSLNQLHTEITPLFPKTEKPSNTNVETKPYIALFNNAGNKFLGPCHVQGGVSVQFMQLNKNLKDIFK